MASLEQGKLDSETFSSFFDLHLQLVTRIWSRVFTAATLNVFVANPQYSTIISAPQIVFSDAFLNSDHLHRVCMHSCGVASFACSHFIACVHAQCKSHHYNHIQSLHFPFPSIKFHLQGIMSTERCKVNVLDSLANCL